MNTNICIFANINARKKRHLDQYDMHMKKKWDNFRNSQCSNESEWGNQYIIYFVLIKLIPGLFNFNKVYLHDLKNNLKVINSIWWLGKEGAWLPGLSLTVTEVEAGSRSTAAQSQSFQEPAWLIVLRNHVNKWPQICNRTRY